MKTLIGGAIAAALGLVGLVIWWGQFLMVLAGIVPAMLLLGGALAIYLGFDELKDTWKSDEAAEPSSEGSEGEGEGEGEGVEQYKKEIDDLKDEIETLKKE
jgi:phosphate/sulfate permease